MSNERYQPLIDDKIKKTTTQIIPQGILLCPRSFTLLAEYDPFKVPPNFDEAEAHYVIIIVIHH